MKVINSAESETSNKSRLGLKLTALFLLGFLAIFIGGLAIDIFSGLAESQRIKAEIAAQPTTVLIDPKLEADLAKVLETDDSQLVSDLKDPFIDRNNISRNSNTPVASVAKVASTTVTPTSSNNNKTSTNSALSARNNASSKQGGVIVQNSGGRNEIVKPEIVTVDTLTRILKRDENIRVGLPVGPESEVFAIEDLLPVGEVSGGNGEREILLYSQSADRTYSFPVGTRFYDGWLSGIKDEGAVFSFDTTKEVRLKSWVRSIQPRSATTSVMIGSPNQTMIPSGN